MAKPYMKTNFTLNVDGNLWLKDENNFGHKLLTKMGWKKGKGMGRNEDGIAKCILPREKDHFNEGVVGIHSKGFNALLSSLNEDHPAENVLNEPEMEEISLEKRSKKFRNRIHYQKIIRGKDVSNYSKKDMQSIFGQKLDDCSSSSEVQSNNKSAKSNNDSVECEDPTHTTSSLSVVDYFAKKFQEKKEKLLKLNNKNSVEVLEDNLSHNHFEESHTNASGIEKSSREKLLKSDKDNFGVWDNNLNDNQSDDNHNGKLRNISCELHVEVPDISLNSNPSELDTKISKKRKRKNSCNDNKPKRFKFNGKWIKSILSKTDEASRLFRRNSQNKPKKVIFSDFVSVRKINTKPEVVQGKTIFQDSKYSIQQCNYEQDVMELKAKAKELKRKAKMERKFIKQKELNQLVEEALIKEKELNIRMGKVKSTENDENSFNGDICESFMKIPPENIQNGDMQQGVVKKNRKQKKKEKQKLKKKLKRQLNDSLNLNQSISITEEDNVTEDDNEVQKKKKKKRRKRKQLNEAILNENVSNQDNVEIVSFKSNQNQHEGKNKSLKNKDKTLIKNVSNLTESISDHNQTKNVYGDLLEDSEQKIKSKNSKQKIGASMNQLHKTIKLADAEVECCDEEVQDMEEKNSIQKSCIEELINSKLQKTKSSSVPEINEPISRNGACKSTNTWIESQKVALKMSNYKNIYTNLSNHSILSTANLHLIKGYGNW